MRISAIKFNKCCESARKHSPHSIMEAFTMNKNILDELYDCDLLHLNEVEDTDGAYRAVFERLIKAEKELKRAYPNINSTLA